MSRNGFFAAAAMGMILLGVACASSDSNDVVDTGYGGWIDDRRSSEESG